MQNGHISTYLKQYIDDIEFMEKNPNKLQGLSSGLTDLDKYLNGLRNGELMLIAARPAMGKTGLAVTIAHNVATHFYQQKENKSVLYFNLYASNQQMVKRFIAKSGDISYFGLKELHDSKRIKSVAESVEKLPIYLANDIYDINDIESEIIKTNKQKPVGLIVVDQLTCVQHGNLEDYTEFLTQLKHLAVKYNVSIIALAPVKLNPELRDYKMPRLCDIKGFDKDQSAADQILLLYREYYYIRWDEPVRLARETVKTFKERCKMWEKECNNKKNVCNVFIGKNNMGDTGEVHLSFNAETASFKDWEW